jgi:RimJ/RimL family protein N-acetyltransferase
MDPRTYDAPATLRDGRLIRVRAIRPGDADFFRAAFGTLSERAVYHRFFQAKRGLSDSELRYLTELDFHDHVGLVAVLPGEEDGLIIGVGRFVRLIAHGAGESARAEVAFTVGDDYQGIGVGTVLLMRLAEVARGLGVTTFVADVLPDNTQMLEVFEHSGLAFTERLRDGVVHVELDLQAAPSDGGSPRA